MAGQLNIRQRVPVNLITGFLGVGKTTAIRHLLAHKPVDEYWAVLVNEFGEIGIDGAAIASGDKELEVVEVPGGCICCTTSPMLRVSLSKLLRSRRPQRLLIEPSGLGHASGIVDLLREPGLASALELRSIVTLVDPRQLDDLRYTQHETWRDQIQIADVLIANKSDRADAAQLDRFMQMAQAMFPAKAAVLTSCNGQFDASLLDLVGRARPKASDYPIQTGKPVAQAALSSPLQSSQGWTWPPEQCFSAELLAQLFQGLTQHAAALARAKGVFHTDHGWLLFNWAYGEANAVEIGWRRDSRFELIVDGANADWAAIEQAVQACCLPAAQAGS